MAYSICFLICKIQGSVGRKVLDVFVNSWSGRKDLEEIENMKTYLHIRTKNISVKYLLTQQLQVAITEVLRIPRQHPITSVQKLHYDEKDNTTIETSWVDNKVYFSTESFQEIAAKKESWCVIQSYRNGL